jgi:hypothetical protein
MTFSTDTDTKELLERWAKQDDRSVSYIVRKLIETERVRRMTQLPLAAMPNGDEVDEPQDQMMARLRVDQLPGFIPNDMIKAKTLASAPSPKERKLVHLGTGPGDEVGN